MDEQIATPTPGISQKQSITDALAALELKDRNGMTHHTGYFEEVDPCAILDRISDTLSTAQSVVAFNSDAISAFGDSKHGNGAFCVAVQGINHALHIVQKLIEEERRARQNNDDE